MTTTDPAPRPSAHRHGPDDGPGCPACPGRREVLARAGALTLGVASLGALAACGAGGGSTTARTASADGSLAALADVPVGGAISVVGPDGAELLLTQAAEGTVVGLSAVCTHQGCTVLPEDDRLVCPCHGSVFALDGSNVSGQASEPLPPVEVVVGDDGAVRLAGA